jgi:CRP/FNR family transcriptional regulator, cyclic AMP receptor protein
VRTVTLTEDAETSQSIWQKKLAALPLKSFGAGETVFAEGSKTGQLFILKSGAVSVVKSGTEIAKVAEEGAIFGELSALLDQPHTADVRTLEASQFHVADAVTLLTKDSTALLYVAMILARRVDAANRALLELRGELYTGEPVGLIDSAIGRIQGLLSAIGDGYVRAGANLSMFPPG